MYPKISGCAIGRSELTLQERMTYNVIDPATLYNFFMGAEREVMAGL